MRSSGANLSVRWSRSTDGGRTWAKPAPLALDNNAMSERPRLAAVRGGARAVWYDSRSKDWRWSIWTSLLTSDGRASAAARVSGAGNATWPAIDGDLVSFTTDRDAVRAQRDQTEALYVFAAAGDLR